MFRQYLLVGVPVLALMGCINEPSNDSAKSPASDPGQERDIDINSLEKPLQIKVGDKSVNLYKGPDGILLVESIQPKGETSLLTPEMKGWTWERIQEKLQPEANPAPGLGGLVYEGERPGAAESPLAEGDQGGSGMQAGTLAKTAADAGWFQSNYCHTYPRFSWCLLNRSNSDDFAWSNCYGSAVYIIMNWGNQVHLNIKVGNNNTLSTDILNDGYVHIWTTSSSRNWLGSLRNETHRYDITHTSGNGWHWSGVSW
jgi:hypothetical protein